MTIGEKIRAARETRRILRLMLNCGIYHLDNDAALGV